MATGFGDELAERAVTAGLPAEVTWLRERLSATEGHREAWRAMAQRSWWQRWFGR